ncbi:MAG: hypothetical protein RIT02_2698 [Planctomycetota bacterium]|jgi:hypothetical protein
MSFWTILLLIMFAFPAFIVGILLSLFLLWAVCVVVLVLAELAYTTFTFTKKGEQQ